MVSFWGTCEFDLPGYGSGGGLWPWLSAFLATPCLEHWTVFVVSAILSVLILPSLFFRSRSRVPLINEQKSNAQVSRYFWAVLILTGAVAVIQFASTVWKASAFFTKVELNAPLALELIFSLSQWVTWLLFSISLISERHRSIQTHAPVLRFSWVVNFVLSMFMLSAALYRLRSSDLPEIKVDDAVAAFTSPVSCLLLVAAYIGSTGVSSSAQEPQNGHLSEPLLANGHSDFIGGKSEAQGYYEDAGFVSRLGFLWMNPILKKGSQKVLELGDIPHLGKTEGVEASYAKFKAEWDADIGQGKRFLPFIILRAHWQNFAVTAVLGVLKLCVMYAGPLLIQQFIDFTAQTDSTWYYGAYLVGILLLAKVVEVVTDHQYIFLASKIGLKVWTGLVAAVYQKGLRITSDARQTHGTGKIVNYMSVDSEQISQVCDQVHDLWLLPIQICLALVILYSVVGVATFAGIGTMLVIMAVCLFIASKQQVVEEHIMAAKDHRMKVTNEALSNMKIIKLCAWQEKFLERVESARKAERVWIGKLMYLGATSIFFLWLSPLLVSILTFGTCAVLGIELTAGKVFTAIATFRIVQDPLRAFPEIIMGAAQAMVSVRRLTAYLESPELDSGAVSRLPSAAPSSPAAVVVANGVFKWESEAEAPTLKHINVEVGKGSLAAIVGKVGAGKSSLLACILGEMEKVNGSVTVSGSVAYVPQSPWIQTGTIKDNILFGKAFDERRYEDTLRACALDGDLKQMIHGDQTEIGARGVNLSGGQKQRVQLARAIYQDADVYLLDDIFSALDAHTGSSIFQDCVMGYLSGKTVLLVTHQVEFLQGADLILVMRDGEIVQFGKYDELTNQGTDFGALVDAHNESLDAREFEDEEATVSVADKDSVVYQFDEERSFPSSWRELDHQPKFAAPILICKSPSASGSPNAGSVACTPPNEACRRLSGQISLQEKLEHEVSSKFDKGGGSGGGNLQRQTSSTRPTAAPGTITSSAKLIEDEEREKGRVNSAVYWAYATKALFGGHVVALILIQTGWQALQIASDFWLAKSTSAESLESFDSKRFITVYSELALGSGMFVLARTLLVSFSGLRVAQKFFVDMIRSVFRAPMAFFDTTPIGRVLSRSSADQFSVDINLPFQYGSALAIGFQLLGVLAVMTQVTWQTVFIIVPLGVIFVRYQHYYIASSRELTRLDSISAAPIIQHFAETIAGFVTVRAFGHQDRFVSTNVKLVNTNLAMKFCSFGSNEWLGFRLESIGSVLLCTSTLILVLLPKGMIKPELVGLSLSYGLALNSCLFWVVTSVCHIEQKMVAVERILQYSDLPSEAPLVIEETRPDPTWPKEGSITVKNLKLRYRADAPLVLKGVNFAVKGGEKLGVVGRTGSGKSSLIQALFRLVEPAGGKILVDNVDITKIGLRDLRSKFSIIPQEPTLFEGNVRNNVDPLGEHTDAEIWEALRKCQLADVVKQKEQKLDSIVAENGENWSMGQRQLFCLGRALLRETRILVLDEATASVDTQTDLVLQKIINIEFSSSTVISIAHRIPSVMNSDKVLVMDSGLVKEFGSPQSLMEQSSLFAGLVHEYWNRSGSLHNLAGPNEET